MRRLLLICFLFFEIGAYASKVGPIFPIGSTSAPGIRFTENKGQWVGYIKAKADILGGEMFLSGNAFVYHFVDYGKVHEISHGHATNDSISGTLLKVAFVNASKTVKPTYSNPFPDRQNYFIGDQANWKENVNTYQNVKLQNFYPNIDLVLTSRDQDLKYDLVAKPNADLSKIAIKYSGQKSIKLIGGYLFIETDQSRLVELKPVAYQTINGIKKTVSCDYALNNDEVKFIIGSGYNPNYSLTIDPQIVFSSYTGSKADNFGFTATYDQDGNTYVGGIVFSYGQYLKDLGYNQFTQDYYDYVVYPVDSFPASPGAYQTQFQGGYSDVVIFKFSRDGKRRLYATYLGGRSTDTPHSMIVNSQNQLVVFGATGSNNFPKTFGTFNTTGTGTYFEVNADELKYPDGSSVFISILNETGTALVASNVIKTYGNSGVNYTNDTLNAYYNYGDEFRGEVIVDKNDNVIVATYTSANQIPGETVAKPTVAGDNLDAWIIKASANLSQLKFSKRFGGSGVDAAVGLQSDSKGNLFFAGHTTSTDLAGTLSGLNTTINGKLDGYVAKMDSNGNMLACTYLGTPEDDQAFFVQTNLNDEVYVMGQTWSASYPIVPSGAPFYTDPGSGQFIHKLDNDLLSTGFSTVFGSGEKGPDISPTAFLVDDCGLMYVSGWRGALNAPGVSMPGRRLRLTEAIFEPPVASGFYFAVFSSEMKGIAYGTYFGEGVVDHVDGGTSRFDKRGYIHQAICGGCFGHNTPTTEGVWSRTNKSLNCNMVGVKFDFDTINIKANFTSKPAVKNDTIRITAGQTITFTSNNLIGTKFFWQQYEFPSVTNPLLLSKNPSWIADTNNLGTSMSLSRWQFKVTYDKTPTCRQTNDQTFYVLVEPSITGANICNGDSGQFHILGQVRSSKWIPIDGLSNPDVPNPKILVNQDTSYTVELWAADNSYFGRYKVPVKVVNSDPKAIFGFSSDSSGTYPLTVAFDNQSHSTTGQYFWKMGDGTTLNTLEPAYTFNNIGRYRVTLIVQEDSSACKFIDSTSKYVYVKPKINDVIYCPETPFGTFTVSGGVLCIANINGQNVTGCMPTITFPGTSPMETNVLVYSEQNKPYSYIFTIAGKSSAYQPSATKARFGFLNDSSGTYPLTVAFQNQSFSLTKRYSWSMGDGSPAIPSENPIYTFDKIGRYNIKLKVIDDSTACKFTDSVSKYVYVKPKINDIIYCPDSPFGTFTVLGGTQCLINSNGQNIIGCTPTLTFPGIAPMETQILVYAEQDKPYAYTFTVAGKSSSYPRRNVNAHFGFLNDSAGTYPLTVAFQNQSLPTTNRYIWDMGDGKSTVSSKNPIYTFDKIGRYNIKLKVIDDSTACQFTDSTSKYIYVKPTINDAFYCPEKPIGLFTVSGGSLCIWDVNGTSMTDCKPAITFSGIASTETKVTVYSEQDKPYTYNFTLTGKSQGYPSTIFNYAIDSLKDWNSATVKFIALTKVKTQNWNIGDGKTYTDSIFTAQYNKAANYPIIITGLDTNNCTYQTSGNIDIAFMFIPNVFTPNGDQSNETFEIKGLKQGTVTLQVFNRWGHKIYESGENNYKNDWRADNQEDGIYYYNLKLNYRPEKPYKGWVQVIR